MYANVYTLMYVHMHAYIMHTHTHPHIDTCAHISAYMYSQSYPYAHPCTHIRIHTCVHTLNLTPMPEIWDLLRLPPALAVSLVWWFHLHEISEWLLHGEHQ